MGTDGFRPTGGEYEPGQWSRPARDREPRSLATKKIQPQFLRDAKMRLRLLALDPTEPPTDTHVKWKDISHQLLTSHAARLPHVREQIEAYLAREIDKNRDVSSEARYAVDADGYLRRKEKAKKNQESKPPRRPSGEAVEAFFGGCLVGGNGSGLFWYEPAGIPLRFVENDPNDGLPTYVPDERTYRQSTRLTTAELRFWNRLPDEVRAAYRFTPPHTETAF